VQQGRAIVSHEHHLDDECGSAALIAREHKIQHKTGSEVTNHAR
jgi:hypothetical protein